MFIFYNMINYVQVIYQVFIFVKYCLENSGFRVLNYDELIFIKRSLDVLVVSFILVVNLFCFILDFCFGDNVVGVGGGEGGVWVFGLSFMFFFIDVVFLFFLFILRFLGFGVLD